MKFIPPNEINSFLSILLSSNKIQPINTDKLIDVSELGINFWDFIRSQLNNKIIKTDYYYLISSVVSYKNSLRNLELVSSSAFSDLQTVYCEFEELFSVIAIYLHLTYGIKLYLCLQKDFSIFCTDDITEIEKILKFKTFNIISDINVYRAILDKYSLMPLDLKKLDFEFLSEQLALYNYSQSGIAAVKEANLC